MRGYVIFLALFMFSLSANMITELRVNEFGEVDPDGVSVYGVNVANQHLNMSESDLQDFDVSEQDSSTDILSMSVFFLFKMLPMLLASVKEAFYIVGWLSMYGVPTIIGWIFQVPLWIIYIWEIFQIVTNRSLRAIE
jgi:hypothetical protein